MDCLLDNHVVYILSAELLFSGEKDPVTQAAPRSPWPRQALLQGPGSLFCRPVPSAVADNVWFQNLWRRKHHRKEGGLGGPHFAMSVMNSEYDYRFIVKKRPGKYAQTNAFS